MAIPCVYQFHHPGKNDPSLPGDGFFIPVDCIKAPHAAMNNLRRFVINVTNSVKIYQQAVVCRLAAGGENGTYLLTLLLN